MEIFADRIRERLAALGMTQAKLAELINVSPGTLGTYLKNEKSPTLDKTSQIAKVLGVTIGWLCGEERDYFCASYADLLVQLNELLEVNVEHGIETRFNEKEQCVSFMISDPIVYGYFHDLKRILDLYKQGIIDGELLVAWSDKRLYEAEKIPLGKGDHENAT